MVLPYNQAVFPDWIHVMFQMFHQARILVQKFHQAHVMVQKFRQVQKIYQTRVMVYTFHLDRNGKSKEIDHGLLNLDFSIIFFSGQPRKTTLHCLQMLVTKNNFWETMS